MSAEGNRAPFVEGIGGTGFEMVTSENRPSTSGISPNTATQTQQVTTCKEGRKKTEKKVQKIIFTALHMVTLCLAIAAAALALTHWFSCGCATESAAMEELIQRQIQQLNSTTTSTSEETMALQIEMSEFRSLFYELQRNQSIIEELQRQIEEFTETNTTLQRELMMVRTSAEQEFFNLQTEANELRNLLLELQNNQTVIEELQRQIEEFMETNTTLQREIMMVRAFAEEEIASLQTQLGQLRDLLNNLQQNSSTTNPNATSQPHLDNDVILYQNCSTTMEGGCSINIFPPGVTGSSPCATADIPIDITGYSTLAYWCARTDQNVEANAVVAIPHVNDAADMVHCECNVVVANSNIPQQSRIDCGLFVTRCALYNPGH